MITDLVLTVVLAPLQWVLDAIPAISWPTWFSTSGPSSVVEMARGWGDSVGTLNGWFPVAEFFAAAGIVFAAAVAHLAIRAVRMIVSGLTGGGGSAA